MLKSSTRKLTLILSLLLCQASGTVADSVHSVDLVANWMVYDSVSKKVYATVPSSVGDRGNSITQIDPFEGKIEQSYFIGSEPKQIVVTDDGKYLYAAIIANTTIRRFDLARHEAGLQFPAGADGAPAEITRLLAVPGQPRAVLAVHRSADMAVYDDGVARQHGASGVNEVAINETPRSKLRGICRIALSSVNARTQLCDVRRRIRSKLRGIDPPRMKEERKSIRTSTPSAVGIIAF